MLPVLSLLPLLTTGQAFGAVTLTINGRSDVSVTPAQCSNDLAGRWEPALRGTFCSALQFWVTPGECRDTFAPGDLVLEEVTATDLVDGGFVPVTLVRIPVNQLPLFTTGEGGGGVSCGALGVEHVYKFCSAVSMSLDFTCFSQTVVRGTPATIRYDTLAPPAPQLTNVEPLDSSISVGFTVTGDTHTVRAEVKGPLDADFSRSETVTTDVSTAVVEDLTNDITYLVRVVAIDAADNVSAPSMEVEATPRASLGFWGVCREAGCPSRPGCSTVAGPYALAGLALLRLLARRRRASGI